MYAEVGRNTLEPYKMPSVEVVKELQAILAKQPGYRGYMAIEGQDSQRTFIRIWDSVEAAKAARESPELERFRQAHVVPSVTLNESIGYGEVLHIDMTQLRDS